MSPARPTRRAAFTLIEVLVTLLIISGIMLAVTQVLSTARITRDAIHNLQETHLAGPAIMDLIERDLRALVAYNLPEESLLQVENRVMLGLDGDRLDFVTATDALVPELLDYRFVRSDVCEVGYRLRPNPENDDFLELYRREAFGVDDEPFAGGRFTFLHDRIRGFDVQVYPEDGIDVDPLDEWGVSRREESMGLPARLEIELVLETSPRISREELSVASIDRRTYKYKRVVRLPQLLRESRNVRPVPLIPDVRPPTDPEGQPGSGGTSGSGAPPTSGGGR